MPARKKFVAADVIRDVLVKLEGEDVAVQQRVLDSIAAGLGLAPATGARRAAGEEQPEEDATPRRTGGLGDASAFMRKKQPTSDIERVVCLAYYLKHAQDTAQFKTKNLTDLNKKAGGGRIRDARMAAANAVKSDLLAPSGGGFKHITNLGEDVVEALPETSKVRELRQKHASRSRRGGRRRKKAGRKTSRA